MESEYPSFKFNGESISIIPGRYFSKNDLKNRLHLMGIETNNIQEKSILINLYESSLKDNKNKLKVISQLKKDTENLNARKNMSIRQSLPSNFKSFNNSTNKMTNISCEVNPFNSKEQLINIIKPMHTNKGQYTQNPFISTSISQIQSSNNNSINFSNISNINNQKNNFKNSYESKDNINNNNNSSFISNQEIYFKQNEHKDNSFNDNSKSRIFNQEHENEFNGNNNNNISNNIGNSNSNSNYNIKNNNGISYNQQYEEKLNNYYKINDSKKLTYQENNYKKNSHLNNDDNRKTYTNISNQILYQNKDNNPLNSNLISKDQEYYNTLTNQEYKDLHNIHNDGNNINNSNNIRLSSNLNYQKSNMDNLQNSSVENLDKNITPREKEEIVDISNNLRKRDEDELSTFSLFSTSNFKNYSLYKNRKYICVHIVILSLILICTILILRFIDNSWDSITELPRRIIEATYSFFSSIFFGAYNYWYISIPFIILCVIFFSYFKKNYSKEKCKKILKKIEQDLIINNNYNDNMGITEDQIYQRYFKNDGISYKLFIKKYLPILMKLKQKVPKIRVYSLIQDENINVVYWKILE